MSIFHVFFHIIFPVFIGLFFVVVIVGLLHYSNGYGFFQQNNNEMDVPIFLADDIFFFDNKSW